MNAAALPTSSSAAPAPAVSIAYTASATLRRFHADTASFVRGVRGPIGAGKSVGCVMELLGKAMTQAPNKAGVRRSRWACVRATYPELKSTTIKTFQEWIPETLCPIKMTESPIVGMLTLPMPDGTLVVSEFLFIALDKPRDLGKLLSLELTGAWINEAKELDKAVIDTVSSRVGRYPALRDGGPSWVGVIMDTNSPSSDHWYATLEQDPPQGWAFYRQPPALRVVRGQYEPNPEAENVNHLPRGYGYYLNAISGKDTNWIRAYVLNQYAHTSDGKPVFGDFFAEHFHVAPHRLWPIAKHPVVLGIDFGLTPATVFGQLMPNGQLRITDELQATRMGLSDFLVNAMMPLIASKYAEHERTYVADPSGAAAGDTDERSCFNIMVAAGLPVVPASTNAIEPRLEAVRSYLSRTVGKGEPALLISPHCRQLIEGLASGYKFARVQVSGEARYRDKPDKNSFSHLQDALQYLALRATTLHKRSGDVHYTMRPAPVVDAVTGY